ncbi:unnamed protein product [Vicia faba]|uniref:Uncharacterized protein n=1 Tax=Vicia faba TaxID=3906 RepID=A0AAV1AE54_VICFA|nr:unnamed protein product [Vicia faba]
MFMGTDPHSRPGYEYKKDRAVASISFTKLFDLVKVKHLSRHGSDHSAISITLEADIEDVPKKRQHIFRFVEVWLKDPKCEALIEKMWKSPILQGLEKLLKEDIRWDVNVEEIKTQKNIEVQRNDFLKMEEIIWRQKSQAVWLHHGDRNTKFFHDKANQRSNTNTIKKLKEDQIFWWKGYDKCKRLLINHFSEGFLSSHPYHIEECCECVKDTLAP